jgi:hypothetical protein
LTRRVKKIARHFQGKTFILCFIVLIAGTVLVASPSMAAQSPITVPLGDVITLKGVAPGSDSVYLFLTGPNLPSNGVKLDNIRSPVVTWNPSTFTKVDVINDRWSYKWYTKTSGGVLDAGSYTVYAVTQPVGRSDLQYADYTIIPVSLTPDVITAGAGVIWVNSTPTGAEVYFEGKLVGYTPVRIVDLPPGDYTIVLKKEGYLDGEEKVSLREGPVEISKILERSGNPTVQTTTAPATSSPTAVPPSPSPTKAPWPVIALIFSLVAAGVFLSSHRQS